MLPVLGLVPAKVWIGAGLAIAAAAGLWYVRHDGFKAGALSVQVKLEQERAGWERERVAAALLTADWERAARAASDKARETERTWLEAARSIDRDGQAQVEKQRAAAGRAGAALTGLHAQLGAVVTEAARSAEASASAADARQRATVAEAARVQANLLGRCYERSVARAVYADDAASRGERCERWADALTSKE